MSTKDFFGIRSLLTGFLILGATAPVLAQEEAEEEDAGPHVLVGQVEGTNTLGFAFEATEPDPITGAVIIPINTFESPITFTGLTGFRNIPFDIVQDLAFEAPGAEEADELAEAGLVPIAETANIVLEAVELPDNFSIFLSGQEILNEAGDTLVLGNPEFDQHPLYIFETDDPLAFGQSTTGTFRFSDTTGTFADSGTFQITLQVVPEPTAASLLMLGAGALLHRRRRSA